MELKRGIFCEKYANVFYLFIYFFDKSECDKIKIFKIHLLWFKSMRRRLHDTVPIYIIYVYFD